MKRLNRWAAAFAVSVSITATTAVVGHAADTEEATAADKIEVIVLTDAELNASGVPVFASLEELAGRSGGRGLEKVTLLGQARSQESAQGALGQVVWYGVKATVDGSEKKAGLRSPLKSAFITPGGALPTETRLQAQGDVDSLIETARALLKEPAAAEEEEEEEDEEKEEERKQDGNGQVGGGAAQNPIAGAYEPAQIQEATKTATAAAAQMESADGCKPRVDLENGVVYPTSKIVTIQDGTVTEETACTDAGSSFPLQWSKASCEAEIDVPAMLVYPHAQGYFVGDDGLPVYVSECARRGGEEFIVTRDDDTCSAVVDMASLTATLRYQLVYTDARGAVNVAQACQPDAEMVVPVTESFAGCSYRHENGSNISYRQSRYTFLRESGEEKVVTSCADTGEPIPHEFDIAACTPAVDMESGQVTPLAKRQITTAEGVIGIAGCTPMDDMMTDIRETVAGCEYTFNHDIPAGVSYPTSRFYYELEGERSYVTDCEVAAVEPLQHKYETVDWQYNDPSKEAKPIDRIFINAPAGEVEVASAKVRDGVSPVPYTFVKTGLAADLEGKYWEGCNAYTPQNNVGFYNRPDTTEVSYVIDAASPSGPVDECQRTPQYRNNEFVNTYMWAQYGDSNLCASGQYTDGSRFSRLCPGSGQTLAKRMKECSGSREQRMLYYRLNFASYTRHHLVYPDGSEGYTAWQTSNSYNQQFTCAVTEGSSGPDH
ncbi:MAG: hypothetical protein RLN99_11580 [Kiloniellaceae bacterium]